MGDPIAQTPYEINVKDRVKINPGFNYAPCTTLSFVLTIGITSELSLRATSEIFYHILEKNYTYYGNTLHTQLP